jgi:tRNA(Arg) A34 adenosine deaminase TadA
MNDEDYMREALKSAQKALELAKFPLERSLFWMGNHRPGL